MKRILAEIGLVLASVALVLSIAVPAHADFTDNQWCDNQSTALCVYSDNVDGDLVYGKTLNTSWTAEKMYLQQQTGVCSDGTVHYFPNNNTGCPFTVPSLDQALQGAEIVNIGPQFPGYGCYVATAHDGFSNPVWYDKSCGTGNLWVEWAGADSGFHYLANVNKSDSNSALQYLEAQSADNILITSGASGSCPAHCEWQQS